MKDINQTTGRCDLVVEVLILLAHCLDSSHPKAFSGAKFTHLLSQQYIDFKKIPHSWT